jgi:hypothetical protein
LSGQSCFAFHIKGEADGQMVDDADAISFAVITVDQKRYIVSTTDVVVMLEPSAQEKVDADDARGFLQERGLPERNISVREDVVREGEVVIVKGRRTELRLRSAGYRDDERRMMLAAGDGKPVILSANKGR